MSEVTPRHVYTFCTALEDDAFDAYEAMKLVILRHKANDWRSQNRAMLVRALCSLVELCEMPGDDKPVSPAPSDGAEAAK